MASKPFFRSLFFPLFLALGLQAAGWEESPQLAKIFRDAGVTGTFVLYDPAERKLTLTGLERARTRFVPASTFKIAHTLIGLSVEAMKDVDEPIPYGGEEKMALRKAMALSKVPVYQALARRIGPERMKEGLELLRYGNRKIGDKIDRFWLDGPLEISALEQVEFLEKVANGRFSLPGTVFNQTAEILLQDEKGEWALFAKTGWASTPDPEVGWWVGWVEKGERIYPFALNMVVENKEQLPLRIELGKACLRELRMMERGK